MTPDPSLAPPRLAPADLAHKSIQYRRTLLAMIKRSNSGHTGGSLSCVDILNVLYNNILRVDPANPAHPQRDRYIHSKGHSVEALYTVLADRGFFPASELDTFERYGTRLIGHPTRKVPGVEQNTGALGHGLPLAVGAALAAKKDAARSGERPFRVFTILGDGELTEGSVWEATMSAPKFKADNLIAIVDWNGVQLDGTNDEILPLGDLKPKFEVFGWDVQVCDGHDIGALADAVDNAREKNGKPKMILARTVKGKGVSFMEGKNVWHGKPINDEEFAQAMKELGGAQ